MTIDNLIDIKSKQESKIILKYVFAFMKNKVWTFSPYAENEDKVYKWLELEHPLSKCEKLFRIDTSVIEDLE